MDSVLDSAYLGDGTVASRRPWADRWVRAMDSLGLVGTDASQGRLRMLSLDRKRLVVTLLMAVLSASILAAGFAWRSQQQQAEQAARLAVDWVDHRLDTVSNELARLISQHQDEQLLPAGGCSDLWVELLLDASLDSAVVRRFEWAQAGQGMRCGPQGPRVSESVSLSPHPGLKLILGRQIGARPFLADVQRNGISFKAELEERALNLPSALWPPQLAGADMGITLMSADGGVLPVWGPAIRPESASQAAVPAAVVSSDKHQLSVRAQPQASTMWSTLGLQTALAALGAVVLVLAGAAVAWRRAVLRSRLVYRLGTALRRRQFEPFVQPIIDLSNGRCIGGEVLMRWNHPQRGILGPGEFIEEAERTGLIIGMSELTMRLAAHRLSPLALANPSLYFSFNVTPGQLREPGFARQLNEIFRPDTLPQQQVLLELTERDFVDPRAAATLLALKAGGWRIAIDDFGTGQSSLASIERLSVDRIKIDRAFVSTIEEATVKRPVLDAIIGLSRELGVPLIAEGVETRAQWDYLAGRGVASAQGYLMARPMPIGDLLRWVPANLAEHPQRSDLANLPTDEKTLNRARAGDVPMGLADRAERHNSAPLAEVSEVHRDLWRRMGAEGGLDIKDRSHRMRIWPDCFIGSEAVDWLASHLRVSRKEALRCGRAMLAVGLIRHVAGEHDFEDGHYFYRLADSAATHSVAVEPEVFALKKALQSALNIPWGTHGRGLIRHQRCATGRCIVDWILQQHPVSRTRAALWAAQLMRLAALRHVFDDEPFKDDGTLYRLG